MLGLFQVFNPGIELSQKILPRQRGKMSWRLQGRHFCFCISWICYRAVSQLVSSLDPEWQPLLVESSNTVSTAWLIRDCAGMPSFCNLRSKLRTLLIHYYIISINSFIFLYPYNTRKILMKLLIDQQQVVQSYGSKDSQNVQILAKPLNLWCITLNSILQCWAIAIDIKAEYKIKEKPESFISHPKPQLCIWNIPPHWSSHWKQNICWALNIKIYVGALKFNLGVYNLCTRSEQQAVVFRIIVSRKPRFSKSWQMLKTACKARSSASTFCVMLTYSK